MSDPVKPQVVYLSASQVPSETANSVHVMKMCAAMSRWGVGVTLVADHGTYSTDPFEFYDVERSFRLVQTPLSRRGPYALRHVLRALFAMSVVMRLLLRGALGSSDSNLAVYARDVPSLSLVRLLRVNFILELHDLPHVTSERSKRNRLRSKLVDSALRDERLLQVVVITEALRRDLLSRGWSSLADRTVVAEDAADPPGTCLEPPVDDGPGVGYVGSLGPGRGLEIIEQVALELPDVTFHIVGGRQHQLPEWIRRFATCPNVVMHGFVPQKSLPCKYRLFSVALAPYQPSVPGHQGDDTGAWMSPLKLFEYMSYGKAIIASDIAVLREVMNENNAVLVDPNNPSGWAAAVERLLCDVELLNRLASGAATDFARRYTWEARARRILQVLLP